MPKPVTPLALGRRRFTDADLQRAIELRCAPHSLSLREIGERLQFSEAVVGSKLKSAGIVISREEAMTRYAQSRRLKKLSEANVRSAVAMVQRGLSAREVATTFGVTHRAVMHHVNAAKRVTIAGMD